MNEIWKPLIYDDVDLTDKFEISNLGKLRNIVNKKIIKTQINNRGYEEVCISLGQRYKCKVLKIHRAVAFMFVDGYKKGLFVNHIDGNKLNNSSLNLEWVTAKENTQHARKNGLLKYCKPIMCEQNEMIFDSILEAAKWCGLNSRGRSLYDYLNHPERRKSAGKHPITKEPLTWHLL